VIALDLVRRLVTRLAKRMENVGGFLRDDSLVGKAAKRLLKGFAFVAIERVMSGNPLAQQFSKLPQLEDRRVRIVPEITPR